MSVTAILLSRALVLFSIDTLSKAHGLNHWQGQCFHKKLTNFRIDSGNPPEKIRYHTDTFSRAGVLCWGDA